MRILRKPEVLKFIGLSAPTLWRLQRKGLFPQPVRLTNRAVGWKEEEVMEWVENRPRTGEGSHDK